MKPSEVVSLSGKQSPFFFPLIPSSKCTESLQRQAKMGEQIIRVYDYIKTKFTKKMRLQTSLQRRDLQTMSSLCMFYHKALHASYSFHLDRSIRKKKKKKENQARKPTQAIVLLIAIQDSWWKSSASQNSNSPVACKDSMEEIIELTQYIE